MHTKMTRTLEGTVGRAIGRVTMAAVLFISVLLVPLSAFGSGQAQASTLSRFSSVESRVPLKNDSSKDSMPVNQDQPEESGKAPASSSQVEEEIKAHHGVADLSAVLVRTLARVERVDHSYEAWFYSVTHPPLTPPPNAG